MADRDKVGPSKVSLPSPEEIAAAQTPGGGWTAKSLAGWGVPWPPPAGWRRALEKRWNDEVHLRESAATT